MTAIYDKRKILLSVHNFFVFYPVTSNQNPASSTQYLISRLFLCSISPAGSVKLRSMKISCIIPTRNRSSMVLEAIASIRRQQYPDLEIIVVDDGSTDNTQAAIKSMFPEIRQVRLNGVGPGLARNAGADAANGNILMFLDSDDLWLENHVQQLQDILNRGFQVAYGATKTIVY